MIAGLALMLSALPSAQALPAFARQTGQRCAACHTGGDFPQLTPWGRYFKLSGYTAGRPFVSREGLDHAPVGAFGQAGVTWAAEPDDASGATVVPANGALRAEQVVLYAATKLGDSAGMFYEYQYSNNFPDWSWSTGIADFRAVHFFTPGSHELLVGIDLNNTPTGQDVWNTVPPWIYPFYGSPVAPGPPASTMISTLGSQVAGLGAYALLDRDWYAEFSLYFAGTGAWSFMTQGTEFNQPGGANYVSGINPYWRVYYNPKWGPHDLMVGSYGMYSKVYPDNQSPRGRTDSFTDYAIDAQYQYLPDALHAVTLRATLYRESQDWNGSYPLGNSSVRSADLSGGVLSGSYNVLDAWSFSTAWFSSNGSRNAALYAVPGPSGPPSSASPDTSGYYLQGNWLPSQNLKVQLQYSGYTRYNGRTDNVDGDGRSASDNNSLWLNLFLAL